MVHTKRTGRRGTAAAAATLAAFLVADTVHSFAVTPVPATVGHVQNLRQAGATSSFLRAVPARAASRAGEASPTSLSSSYVVKSEMARSRGSEWRKLRTRGPGFGEKARVFFVDMHFECNPSFCRAFFFHSFVFLECDRMRARAPCGIYRGQHTLLGGHAPS